MKRIAVALALVGSAGLITEAAQRIVTHAAEPYFKRLFPNAVAFSPHMGTPLHYKAYGADPAGNPNAPPIGLIFWTTDLVPNEHGYHGAIHMLVGMDMTGILSGVIVTYDSEPYERARAVSRRRRRPRRVARDDQHFERDARRAG
jgi:transcriptional regulator of nitric oxide reductase